ncbi:MAG: hypothetical protein HC800_22165, partial [Phormidesmis sp. RL_2_1]|nr:hypothetical protein [Phormidesmis sp. RL_2_1]
MLDNSNSGASSFSTSQGSAIWQSGWIDELWGQLTSGTFSGIDNVVLESDIAQTRGQVLADLDAIDRIFLGSNDIDKLLSNVQKFARSNSFNPGIDSVTGSPITQPAKSLARVMQYLHEKGLPDLTAQVGTLTLDQVSLPGAEGALSITLTNHGGLKTESPVNVKVFATRQPALDNSAVEIGAVNLENLKLAVNSSKAISAAVKLPNNFAPGDYNLFVVIDADKNLPEANEANNVIAIAAPQKVAWQFGNVGTRKDVQLQLTESDGDVVRFNLKGDGYGEVTERQGVKQIALYGTTDKSDLTIQADGDGNIVENVVVNGDLKQFYGTKTDLQGNFTISGSLERLVLDDISNAQISIGPSNKLNHGVEIKLDQASNLTITSQSAIKSLSANSWTTVNGGSSLVKASELDVLKIKDGFNANVDIARGLKQAKIEGIAAGIWKLGTTNQLDLNSTAASWSLTVAGELTKLDVQNDMLGSVAAGSLKRIFVRGDLANAKVLVGANFGADGRAGGGDDSYGSGELEEFIVYGNVLSSVIGAGLNPRDSSFVNGNEQLVAGGRIGNIEVKGQVSADSRFAAAQFGSGIKLDKRTINPEVDARFLTLSKVIADVDAPVVTLTLKEDTGSNGTDKTTSVTTVIGTVSDESEISRLRAGFGNTPAANYVDISQYLKNGSFTLDMQALSTVLGRPLTDGSYTLYVIAEDSFGNVSAPVSYSYVLDRTGPTLSTTELKTANTADGLIHLIGSVNEPVTVIATLNAQSPKTFTIFAQEPLT